MEQLYFKFSTPPAKRQLLIDPALSFGLRKCFSERFTPYFGRPFVVRFHANSSTMISCRQRPEGFEIRLHHMFIQADNRVLDALGHYLRGSKQGQEVLDGFIERHRDQIAQPSRPLKGSARGRHFHLERIKDAVNRHYFKDSPVGVPVIWGKHGRLRRSRSIRLGSYSFGDQLIRIHPALDSDVVPSFVVVSVVYHEMLHHHLGCEKGKGRRRVHTAAFRQMEKAYVHFQKAAAWEHTNLHLLLRRNRRQKSPHRGFPRSL